MVQISLKKAGPATLQLFDFAGKLVQTVPTEVLAAIGNYAGEINLPNP